MHTEREATGPGERSKCLWRGWVDGDVVEKLWSARAGCRYSLHCVQETSRKLLLQDNIPTIIIIPMCGFN